MHVSPVYLLFFDRFRRCAAHDHIRAGRALMLMKVMMISNEVSDSLCHFISFDTYFAGRRRSSSLCFAIPYATHPHPPRTHAPAPPTSGPSHAHAITFTPVTLPTTTRPPPWSLNHTPPPHNFLPQPPVAPSRVTAGSSRTLGCIL